MGLLWRIGTLVEVLVKCGIENWSFKSIKRKSSLNLCKQCRFIILVMLFGPGIATKMCMERTNGAMKSTLSGHLSIVAFLQQRRKSTYRSLSHNKVKINGNCTCTSSNLDYQVAKDYCQ